MNKKDLDRKLNLPKCMWILSKLQLNCLPGD